MKQNLGRASRALVGALFGTLAAFAVAVALAGGYREGEIVDVLVALTLPPLVLLFVYEGSEKRFIACMSSLLIAAFLFDLSPAMRIGRAGINLVLLTIGALATPVIVDLLFIDMGRQVRIRPPLARMTQVAFALAILPLAVWTLSSAHRTILKEDQKLVDQLASRMTPEGHSIVLDRLDPKMRDRAQRRIGIRTDDNKTYSLSDADIESVREERTVRKETKERGVSKGTEVTKEQEERMRLILKLQGTEVPDDVVLFSHRGPLTIYEVKVPLNRHGS